jgi:hypothetical protein
MRKIYFLIISFILLTGCAQNLALLGPVISVAKTGGIHQAVIGGTINHGIKSETGKDVSEHVMNLIDKETKEQNCKSVNSNSLQEIFFENSEDIECKSIQ